MATGKTYRRFGDASATAPPWDEPEEQEQRNLDANLHVAVTTGTPAWKAGTAVRASWCV